MERFFFWLLYGICSMSKVSSTSEDLGYCGKLAYLCVLVCPLLFFIEDNKCVNIVITALIGNWITIIDASSNRKIRSFNKNWWHLQKALMSKSVRLALKTDFVTLHLSEPRVLSVECFFCPLSGTP